MGYQYVIHNYYDLNLNYDSNFIIFYILTVLNIIKMALLDNKEYALAFIRNAFVSSDDTEMCEHVLENNGYVKNRRLI